MKRLKLKYKKAGKEELLQIPKSDLIKSVTCKSFRRTYSKKGVGSDIAQLKVEAKSSNMCLFYDNAFSIDYSREREEATIYIDWSKVKFATKESEMLLHFSIVITGNYDFYREFDIDIEYPKNKTYWKIEIQDLSTIYRRENSVARITVVACDANENILNSGNYFKYENSEPELQIISDNFTFSNNLISRNKKLQYSAIYTTTQIDLFYQSSMDISKQTEISVKIRLNNIEKTEQVTLLPIPFEDIHTIVFEKYINTLYIGEEIICGKLTINKRVDTNKLSKNIQKIVPSNSVFKLNSNEYSFNSGGLFCCDVIYTGQSPIPLSDTITFVATILFNDGTQSRLNAVDGNNRFLLVGLSEPTIDYKLIQSDCCKREVILRPRHQGEQIAILQVKNNTHSTRSKAIEKLSCRLLNNQNTLSFDIDAIKETSNKNVNIRRGESFQVPIYWIGDGVADVQAKNINVNVSCNGEDVGVVSIGEFNNNPYDNHCSLTVKKEKKITISLEKNFYNIFEDHKDDEARITLFNESYDRLENVRFYIDENQTETLTLEPKGSNEDRHKYVFMYPVIWSPVERIIRFITKCNYSQDAECLLTVTPALKEDASLKVEYIFNSGKNDCQCYVDNNRTLNTEIGKIIIINDPINESSNRYNTQAIALSQMTIIIIKNGRECEYIFVEYPEQKELNLGEQIEINILLLPSQVEVIGDYECIIKIADKGVSSQRFNVNFKRHPISAKLNSFSTSINYDIAPIAFGYLRIQKEDYDIIKHTAVVKLRISISKDSQYRDAILFNGLSDVEVGYNMVSENIAVTFDCNKANIANPTNPLKIETKINIAYIDSEGTEIEIKSKDIKLSIKKNIAKPIFRLQFKTCENDTYKSIILDSNRGKQENLTIPINRQVRDIAKIQIAEFIISNEQMIVNADNALNINISLSENGLIQNLCTLSESQVSIVNGGNHEKVQLNLCFKQLYDYKKHSLEHKVSITFNQDGKTFILPLLLKLELGAMNGWTCLDLGTSAIVLASKESNGNITLLDLKSKCNIQDDYQIELDNNIISSTTILKGDTDNPNRAGEIILNPDKIKLYAPSSKILTPVKFVAGRTNLPFMDMYSSIRKVNIDNKSIDVKNFTPSMYIAQTYKKIFDYIEANSIERLIFTYPNTYTPIQLDNVKDVIKSLPFRGLREDGIIAIPESDAVVAYYVNDKINKEGIISADKSNNEVIIYDMGAGTLDITLFDIKKVTNPQNIQSSFKVEIIKRLGIPIAGEYLDWVLYQVLCDLNLGSEVFNPEMSKVDIKFWIKGILKPNLSSANEAILINNLGEEKTNVIKGTCKVTIKQILESRKLNDYIEICADKIFSTICDNNKQYRIVCSGRASRFEPIRKALEKRFENNIESIENGNLKTCVAQGAIHYMSIFNSDRISIKSYNQYAPIGVVYRTINNMGKAYNKYKEIINFDDHKSSFTLINNTYCFEGSVEVVGLNFSQATEVIFIQTHLEKESIEMFYNNKNDNAGSSRCFINEIFCIKDGDFGDNPISIKVDLDIESKLKISYRGNGNYVEFNSQGVSEDIEIIQEYKDCLWYYFNDCQN